MILVNDKLEVIYDDEDFVGRQKRMLEGFEKQGLFKPVAPWTPEDVVAIKAAPVMMVLDSFAGMP